MIRDFLQPFCDATKALEGRDATLEHFLPALEFLCQHFEQGYLTLGQDNIMLGSLDAGHTKLLKYYDKADSSPVYIAAVILNPRFKWTLFDRWEETTKKRAKDVLMRFWRAAYRSNTGIPQREPHPASNINNTFFRWLDNSLAVSQDDSTVDELDKYLRNDIPVTFTDGGAREWWLEPAQRIQYPLLSRMAVDILSIPAMSSEVERLFSTSKKTISEGRWKLKPLTIEALECSKAWHGLDLLTIDDLRAGGDEEEDTWLDREV